IIVRVQDADIIGPSHRDAFVQRIGLPAIGLRYPSQVGVRPGLFAEDLHSAIGRPAVDDNVLDSNAVLGNDRLDASGNKTLAVENGCDDAERRCRFHALPRARSLDQSAPKRGCTMPSPRRQRSDPVPYFPELIVPLSTEASSW